MSKQLIVIGGGAAGFFCAINAARQDPSLKVIILEKTGKLLSKVKVSGGGRCNVTHACFDIAEMSRRYPRGSHFIKKGFHQFFTTHTIQWFEERGVKLKTEKDGRMFPVTDSSQTIIDCLLKEVNKYGIEIRMNTEVISLEQEGGQFQLELSNDRQLKADLICVASGGYPKTSLFEWLKQTGHSIEEPVPSLFTFNLSAGQAGMPRHAIVKLMGVSVENVMVKIAGTKLEQQGPLLITHWGISGPAVLKLSAWAARELKEKSWKFTAVINWLPEYKELLVREMFQQLRKGKASQKINSKNIFRLPARLWEFLLLQLGIKEEMRWADLSSALQNKLIKSLCMYECEVKGKTTFKEEFVTAGGIRLSEIDPNTMMSKKVPGLFFAGEVMDVDGITGGYNFQHAWTSGWIAAKSIATRSPEAI